MLRLTVMSGPQDGQEASARSSQAIVGPAPASDLCLPHDPQIDPEGATIQHKDGLLTIKHGALEFTAPPGELFRLGQTWLKVVVEE